MTPLFTMAASPCQQSKKHGWKCSLGEKKEETVPDLPEKMKALTEGHANFTDAEQNH